MAIKNNLQTKKFRLLLFVIKQLILGIIMILIGNSSIISQTTTLTFPIPNTGVIDCYDNSSIMDKPKIGEAFYGQNGNYTDNAPSYKDNGDGTITDNITGLTWQKDPGVKITYANAFIKADTLTLGGFTDWRVPTIKELYSLIIFTGRSGGTTAMIKYIDTNYFIQPIGNTAIGEREIDAQTWSSTQYAGLTMGRDSTVFGVNFIDGRIKGYPKYKPGSNNTTPNSMYFRMVRGNEKYGINKFTENSDGTVSDIATGLMWQKSDAATAVDWEHALEYAEKLELADYSDWRLPNAKELQSIVDYSRSPQATQSPAINPIFNVTSINDPNGNPGHYPYFWTSTTHLDGPSPYSGAVYVAFGKALGKMNGVLLDVHGAGAQRSDPKTGNPADYPQFQGPQGDARIVFNYVRCVRNIKSTSSINENIKTNSIEIAPNPSAGKCYINLANNYYNINIDLFSTLGELLKSIKLQNSNYCNLDTSDLNPGTYFLRLNLDNTFSSHILIVSR